MIKILLNVNISLRTMYILKEREITACPRKIFFNVKTFCAVGVDKNDRKRNGLLSVSKRGHDVYAKFVVLFDWLRGSPTISVVFLRDSFRMDIRTIMCVLCKEKW